MTYNGDYWVKYYRRNKERILDKNKKWRKSNKGKEYYKRYWREKIVPELLAKKAKCAKCGRKITVLGRWKFCSDKCLRRFHGRKSWERLKSDPERYARFKKLVSKRRASK